MMKYAIKNQFNRTEMPGNEAQITQGEEGSRKMTIKFKKQIQNQLQTSYMQNNESQIISGEAERKTTQMPQEKIIGKTQIRQDRIIENQSQSGEMMIKNTQNKKENSKNESMLSEQYIYKKNIIQTHSQSGRSMVEMLGVLAIIAILSIGGIVGFRLAMNHYQASQIAHEMNMMRTDAQIKIAQGTEKLILGEPYDPVSESTLGHIQFNDDYPVDFACALADDETVELSNISCHVANAYYIELQNIPEGVCRPLAELVNGMNNIIAFNVNKNEYPGGGKCETGNGNVLNAVFSAEAVSELKVCAEDTDCESENAPHCDPSRHVCVSCYEDNQCAHSQYCEDNTCVTCESGVWNGEECVECTEDDDCENPTPICSEDNTCTGCTSDEQCRLKNSSEENCVSGGACCKDPRMTWNNGKCECPEDEPWNGESCGCKSNDDCETNEYCHIVWRVLDESGNITYMKDNGACGKGDTGICRSLGNYQSQDLGDDTYYISDINMVWWSAENYCQALGKIGKGSGKMVSWSKLDLNCDNDIILEDGCKCGENGCSGGDCGSVIYKSGDGVYCLKDASLPQSQTNIPDKIIKIRDLFFNGQSKHVWLADVSSCFAKTFRTDGYIYMRARYFGYGSKSTDGYAFCY